MISARLGFMSSRGFDPRSIANLAAWYDASISGCVTIATGVSRWADQSGNGRDYIQSTGNNQPVLTSNAINGLPAITFDGSNDFLQTATFTLGSPHTVFLVMKFVSAWSSGTQTVIDGFNGSSCRLTRTESTTGTYGTNIDNAASGISWTNWSVVAMQLNVGTGGSLTVNNSTVATTSSVGSQSSAAGLTLGRYGSAGIQYSPISVAAQLHYSRALTSTEITTASRGLGAKFGIVF